MLEIIELEISNHHKQGLWRRSRAFHTLKVKLASLTLSLTASLISWRLEMRAKNFVVNRGISCVNRGISCVNRGVSCFIRCILSCFIRCNPVFQSWSSRRERVKKGFKKFYLSRKLVKNAKWWSKSNLPLSHSHDRKIVPFKKGF